MERWKDIKGFEGLYQISDFGNVKTLINDRLLKQDVNSTGYARVFLKNKKYFVHRLVAQHFIENKYDCPCVNHIDNNPLNNRYDNLEWCTQKQNMEHAKRQGRMKLSDERKEKISANAQKRKIGAIVIKTGEREVYNSIQEASRILKGSAGNICDCCKNQHHTYYGRRFYYL